jgi:hypothetical protein
MPSGVLTQEFLITHLRSVQIFLIFTKTGSRVVYGWVLAFPHGATGTTVSGGTDMETAANGRAPGDVHMDRGSPRRAGSQTTSAELSTIMNAGITPDRRAANDRRRGGARAKTIPTVRMAGSANGCTQSRSRSMTAANLAALLVFSSILQF